MIHRGKTFFNNPSIHNEKSDLENYIANRPQNTIWILIKYIVLLIFFLHQFMYINKKFSSSGLSTLWGTTLSSTWDSIRNVSFSYHSFGTVQREDWP